ncbi:MAG: ATP-binding cassette domain-containing protein [Ruminococcaceae bacterium]|nr:ATP-binding cassette domain-containing protein [Oscillospiraceae bacterium]
MEPSGRNDYIAAGGGGYIGGCIVTIFDGSDTPRSVRLNEFGKQYVYFGRDLSNDIVLNSPIVSREHGRFAWKNGQWHIEDKGVYTRSPSTNGLICNNTSIRWRAVSDGDFIRIDDGVETIAEGVLFVFSDADTQNRWQSMPFTGKTQLSVGRSRDCDIVLPHITVSLHHAVIVREPGGCYIIDNNSTNGVIVNNRRISGKVKLHEKDVVCITNSKLIFSEKQISYCCYRSGISVDAADVVIRRGKGRKSFITSNHVDLNIRPGELVAIIGGSGAGKSTILNSMCGYLKPTQGNVYINGVNLYDNFDGLKKLIGYVPQSDIVYDNLTLHQMLEYTAKLRLPKDISEAEREAAITRAINMVELPEKRDSFIRSLSGGQRKRASIAVELLSDPNLLFLDEPASGLDPGTERNLMQSLRRMADGGKTVILVTHSTLQLRMCDKIVFMGKGGNLCYYGAHDDALRFFGVSDIVDVYNMITDNAPFWRQRYEQTRAEPGEIRPTVASPGRFRDSRLRQLAVISARYFKLVTNDRQRLLLLLIQAPLLAVLISFVADGEQFKQYEMSKSLLFALSCSAFWVGMLNAIQEICKERTIMKREYMTGLSLSAYVSSKILVLGVLCLIQSLMITGVFSLLVGLPEEGVMIHPFIELLITIFITAVASSAMGLFVSSLFNNADRAMTVAPLLLMPQILFSGLIFELSGATKIISWIAVCRWSMEGLGTTANLNSLPLQLQQQGIMIPHDAEDFFEFTASHMLASWGILIGFSVLFLVLARIVLSGVGKEKS